MNTMELIRDIEKTAIGFPALKRMLGPDRYKSKLMHYNELRSINSMEELFGKADAVIILLSIETANAPTVGHWIALLKMGQHYEHFDSYGLSVDEELSITHEAPYLTNLVNKSRKKVIDNTIKFQNIREHTNTCARWVVARVRLRHLALAQFNDIFTNLHAVPDVSISVMTMFL